MEIKSLPSNAQRQGLKSALCMRPCPVLSCEAGGGDGRGHRSGRVSCHGGGFRVKKEAPGLQPEGDGQLLRVLRGREL